MKQRSVKHSHLCRWICRWPFYKRKQSSYIRIHLFLAIDIVLQSEKKMPAVLGACSESGFRPLVSSLCFHSGPS